MGLYTQQDPIGLSGGVNLYGYANGDPVNKSDPYGLDEGCTWEWTWEHGMCPIELEGITVTVDRTPECFTSICGPAERDRPWAGGRGGGPGPRGDGGGGVGGGRGAGAGPGPRFGPGTPGLPGDAFLACVARGERAYYGALRDVVEPAASALLSAATAYGSGRVMGVFPLPRPFRLPGMNMSLGKAVRSGRLMSTATLGRYAVGGVLRGGAAASLGVTVGGGVFGVPTVCAVAPSYY